MGHCPGPAGLNYSPDNTWQKDIFNKLNMMTNLKNNDSARKKEPGGKSKRSVRKPIL
jgi:hypothetical protein